MALSHKGFQIEGIPTPFTKIKEIAGGISETVPVIEDGDSIVSDSWDIAVYLEEKYPDRPSLFGGEVGRSLSRFVESWVNLTVHKALGLLIVKDVHEILGPEDQKYFRESREKRFGKSLEDVHSVRENQVGLFEEALVPLRRLLKYQDFLSGDSPLYPDYILFGSIQWGNVACTLELLKGEDPLHSWFNRCQDLFDGIGHSIVKVRN